ncbi:MAG: hypothetical protein WCB79_10490 [Halobacteriota archaeon]
MAVIPSGERGGAVLGAGVGVGLGAGAGAVVGTGVGNGVGTGEGLLEGCGIATCVTAAVGDEVGWTGGGRSRRILR